jgi:hypothetical protein
MRTAIAGIRRPAPPGDAGALGCQERTRPSCLTCAVDAVRGFARTQPKLAASGQRTPRKTPTGARLPVGGLSILPLKTGASTNDQHRLPGRT